MMKILKGYVRSMAQLEGSMAKNYLLEETLDLWPNTCMNFNMCQGEFRMQKKKDNLGRFWECFDKKNP